MPQDIIRLVLAHLAPSALLAPSAHLEAQVLNCVLLAVMLRAVRLFAPPLQPARITRTLAPAPPLNVASVTTVPSVHQFARAVILDTRVLQDLAVHLLLALRAPLEASATRRGSTPCVLPAPTAFWLGANQRIMHVRNASQGFTVLRMGW